MTAAASQIDPLRYNLAQELLKALGQIAAGKELPGVDQQALMRMLEKPPETKLGDYALPCFRFAKPLGAPPPKVALQLSEILSQSQQAGIDRVEVVGAFLNIFLKSPYIAATVLEPAMSGDLFNLPQQLAGNGHTRVMVEFSQPNTHKEFHVGHARNVTLGNCLCRLFRYAGYQVTAANYFGDEGTHIATVLWYLEKESIEAPTTGRGAWLGEMYVAAKRKLGGADDESKAHYQQEISEVLRDLEAKKNPRYQRWQETRQWSLDEFGKIYDWLDVKFDELFYESQVSEASQAIVEEFLGKGVFVEDDGAVGVNLKDYKLGFMIARKRDGNTLYATKDLALARLKFEDYKIDRSIYVVGEEQKHHFKQVFKTLDLMGFKQASQCHHLSYGLVVLPEGKMSSRDGTSVAFDELRSVIMDELQKILEKYQGEWSQEQIDATSHMLCDGVIKHGMLATDPNKQIVFDLNQWTSFEGNSGPYLMYSYSRTRSILEKAAAQGIEPTPDQGNLLVHSSEKELLRNLADFNQVVMAACDNYMPSTLAHHLFQMCKSFNRFYAEVSVLKAEEEALKGPRLALVAAFGKTLNQGLTLLGIRAPERM